MNNRKHTLSELQAILYKMDYYKLTNGFIGVCTKGGTPDFYESKPSFTMFSWEQVSRGDVLKMIDEAENETKQPLYKVLNLERTQGEWIVTKSSSNSNAIAKDSDKSMIAVIADWRHERMFNAQYTALAVNNFNVFAEFMEEIVLWGKCKDGKFTYTTSEEKLNQFKEALNKIS